jgi:hypothetical protein
MMLTPLFHLVHTLLLVLGLWLDLIQIRSFQFENLKTWRAKAGGKRKSLLARAWTFVNRHERGKAIRRLRIVSSI